MTISVLYNNFNIRVEDEHGHYKLSHELSEQRCDTGELNEAIPDFVETLEKNVKKTRII